MVLSLGIMTSSVFQNSIQSTCPGKQCIMSHPESFEKIDVDVIGTEKGPGSVEPWRVETAEN